MGILKKGPAKLESIFLTKISFYKAKIYEKKKQCGALKHVLIIQYQNRTSPQIPGQTLSVHWQCWPAIRRCWRPGGRRRARFLSSGCFWRAAPQLPAFSPELHGSLSYRRYSLHSVTHEKKKFSDNCFIFLHLSTQL